MTNQGKDPDPNLSEISQEQCKIKMVSYRGRHGQPKHIF